MARQLVWTLTSALVLTACGAGEREGQREIFVENPTVQSTAATEGTAPAPAPSPAAVPGESAGDDGMVHPTERLYTVQIAAYLSRDSARALADKLSQRGLPVWTMEVRVGDRTYHRIRVGAHPRLGEMRALGAQIADQFKQEVWVAPVDMSTRIPANTVEATRALLAR